MGLDLRLLPMDSPSGMLTKDWGYSHTILSCDRDRALFEKIREVQAKSGRPVPRPFHTFTGRGEEDGEHGYGDTQTDPYGDPIDWVPAKELTSLAEHIADTRKQRAIWAYLSALDPETPVALYWH